MKKLIALALIMAGLGAAGAIIALRLLSRPRVAPAPFGPDVPLPTPSDLPPDSDLPAVEPLGAEPAVQWNARELAVAADALVASAEADPAPTTIIEPEPVLAPETAVPELDGLAEEVGSGIPATEDAPLFADASMAAEPESHRGTGALDGLAASSTEESMAEPRQPTESPEETPDLVSSVEFAHQPTAEQDHAGPFAPDATDEAPSHHLPPSVSEVVGEPVADAADLADVEPSQVPPVPVSEAMGEPPEAVIEGEEGLALPITETIDQASARPADQPAEAEGDFLTTYFNQLAETPLEGPLQPEPPAGLFGFDRPAEAQDEPLPSSVEEALSTLPSQDISALGRRDAESYLDEGNVYFNVGQYALAIERYGKAIELASDLTAAYYNRANARTRSGEYDGALADYDRALQLQPRDADALNNRGMLHLYRASYGDALDDFNAALSIDPSDTTVMVNRGLAHLHSGEAAAALVDFQSAASLDNNDAAAHYGAAQAAAAMDNRAESLRHLSRALVIDPAYAREAAADPKLQTLQGDADFMRLLREIGSRAER